MHRQVPVPVRDVAGQPDPYTAELLALALESGLDRVAVTSGEPFTEALEALEERKGLGLHAGMQFTYRNPKRATDPSVTLPGVEALIVGAWSYPPERPDEPDEGAFGKVARVVVDDNYGALAAGLEAVAARLRADGYKAVVLVDNNALVDRAAAARAGLGWFGKNANILVPGLGSWVVLGSVATDAPLHHDDEPVADGCGTCTRCIDACPTGAIIAPGVVDARRCLAWLVQAEGDFPEEHREALGGRLYGCDDCQEVCPPNRTFVRHKHARGEAVDLPESERVFVEVLDLLETDDDMLIERHGRWYIPRRDPRYLRRNALVVLGNVGDPASERALALLRRYVDSGDEMLASHAAWALSRLEARRTAQG